MTCEQVCSFCEPAWYAQNRRSWRPLAAHDTVWAYVATPKYAKREIRMCVGCFASRTGKMPAPYTLAQSDNIARKKLARMEQRQMFRLPPQTPAA